MDEMKMMVARNSAGKELVIGQLDDDCEVVDIIGTPSVSDEDEAKVLAELGEDATYHVVER